MDINNEQSMEQLILETAERLFLEKGFAMTSTTEIAKAVGCNQALVHYYFRTKDNLFNVIFEQKFREFFQGTFEFKAQGAVSFQEKLKFIIESHYDILLKNPGIPFLILNELSRRPEQIQILKEKLQSFVEQIFSELSNDLKTEIENKRVRDVSLIDIIFSIISLNVALFIMMPVVESVLQLDENKKRELLLHRKKENVEFVLNSIRP